MVLRVAFIAAVVSIVLNMIVPRVALELVKMIPGSASNIFMSKAMSMFRFHINDPVVTSIVVALLVFLSVVITSYIPY